MSYRGKAGLGVEEAGPGDAGIVGLVAQVPDGEVDRGKLGGKRADVDPENLGEKPLVIGTPAPGLRQRPLA